MQPTSCQPLLGAALAPATQNVGTYVDLKLDAMLQAPDGKAPSWGREPSERRPSGRFPEDLEDAGGDEGTAATRGVPWHCDFSCDVHGCAPPSCEALREEVGRVRGVMDDTSSSRSEGLYGGICIVSRKLPMLKANPLTSCGVSEAPFAK